MLFSNRESFPVTAHRAEGNTFTGYIIKAVIKADEQPDEEICKECEGQKGPERRSFCTRRVGDAPPSQHMDVITNQEAL